MSDPVKSALKSPVSRLSTSKGWSVAVDDAALRERRSANGPARDDARRWSCTLHVRVGARADDGEEGAQVDARSWWSGSSVIGDGLRPAGDDVRRRPTPLLSARAGRSSEASFEKTLTLSSGLNW